MRQHRFVLDGHPDVSRRIAYDEHHYTIFRDERLVGQGAFDADRAVQPAPDDVLAFALGEASGIEASRRAQVAGDDDAA